MSRYIDADALCEYTNNQKDKSITANDFMRFPYIDIVRCKECKHWRNKYGDSACMLLDAWIDADDFCSYGEREGE